MTTTRPTVIAVAVASLALVAAGCGDDEQPGASGGDWPAVSDPLGEDVVTGEVEVDGSEVTLSDGTTIDVGETMRTFVVAGEGVFAVPESPDDAELVYATADGVDGLDVQPGPETLRTSPDGRYLGFVDFAPEPAETVVVDLEEGEEVVRSAEGMGGEDFADYEALYSETDPSVLVVTDEIVYARAAEGVYSFALPSGDVTQVAEDMSEVYEEDWYTSASELSQLWRDGTTGE